MPRITISYRRDDSLDITGRIFDRLAGHFGREAVFRDIDSIPLGTDFRRHIDRVLDQSDIILAIVGPRWIGPDNEYPRLSSPADPVRLEIETALRKDKLLIPVLVSRAVMPHPDVLPDSLHDFVYRNAVQIDSGQDFDVHVGRLIRSIEQLLRIDEQRAADEVVQGAPPLEPTPKAERPAEAARQAEEERRQAEEEKRRVEAARQVEEEKRRVEAARQVEEEKRRVETTPKAEPPAASVAPPVGWPVIRAYGGHTVRWVLGLVVILGIIGVSGWWVLVEQPAEMARREVPAAEKARAEDRASQTAAAAKAQVGDALKNGKAALDSKDYAEAVRWFRKAANQGNADAQDNLGWLYEHGRGVAQDYAEAMRWFRKAADQGDADGQGNIGWLYEYGRGVAQDYAEAMRWYRKAADQGNVEAKNRLLALEKRVGRPQH